MLSYKSWAPTKGPKIKLRGREMVNEREERRCNKVLIYTCLLTF